MAAMEEFQPDLVLMDLHMPGMNGTELTTLIRAHAAFAHTPIVFLTGDPDPERQFEVLEVGADDFLTKPVRPRHLIAAVESRVRARAHAARQRSGERPASGHRPVHAHGDAAAPGLGDPGQTPAARCTSSRSRTPRRCATASATPRSRPD